LAANLAPLTAFGDDRCVVREGPRPTSWGTDPSGTNQENIVAIEHACMRVVRKPWGSTDLRPWSEIRQDGVAIGELWFQRPDMNAPDPTLLLKLLFTKEPLSIQVHPDDAFAQSIGLGHGKTSTKSRPAYDEKLVWDWCNTARRGEIGAAGGMNGQSSAGRFGGSRRRQASFE
jgi:hypothetical protein